MTIMIIRREDSTIPKKPDARKVDEARARFVERFGYAPAEVLNKAPGLWWLGPVKE